MSELWNVRLVGTVESLSPICVVPPNTDEVTRPDGSKYRRVARRTIYQDGMRETKPVLPGSTLRGRLRRSAVEVVLGLTGATIPLEEWHQNAVGGIKGAEAESGHDVLLRQRIRDKNPILALFGAGSPWMISRASVGDAVPIGPVDGEIIGGVRADDGKRDNGFFAKLDDAAQDDWLAMADANAARTKFKARARELQADLRAARKGKDATRISELEADQRALQGEEDEAQLLASNPVSMPLQHEAMPAGVSMLNKMSLTAVTAAEAGIFFAAMNLMFKVSPHLGQHGNLGYGLVRGEYDLFITRAGVADPFEVETSGSGAAGTMIAEPHVGLSNVPAQVVAFMTAFREGFAAGTFDFRLVSKLGKE